MSDASSCPSRCATPWAWPGSTVDISLYGAGLTVVPGGRTARLVEEDGHLVADVDVENGQEAPVTDRRRCASNPADLPPS